VASSAATPAPVRLPEAWPQDAITEGLVLASPHWEPARAAPTLIVAVPVLSVNNELLGALAAVIDLRVVQPQLKGTASFPSGEVTLLDSSGWPLVGTLPITTRQPLQDEVLRRLHAQPDRPFEFQGFDQRLVLGVADAPGQR